MDNNSNPPAPSEATTDFTPAASSPEPVIGTLGRFQLRREIGQGAFGIVYRAYDPVLEREVALKVPKFAANRPDLRERFLREAKAAARLRHPHIVTVHDCGSAGDRFYIAFEFVEGKPLSELMVAERPGYRQIAQWVRDLALALHHAHEQGVLHRDVKPANILIDSRQRCRLTDFGLSKDVLGPRTPTGGAGSQDVALTHEGAVPGTPAYMAPEQARGDAAAVGPRTDQYGLGVVLYELLTGHRPYEGPAERVIAWAAAPQVEAKRPREHNADIPYGLDAIVWKALRNNPEERYTNLAEVAVDLQRWLKGEPVSVPLYEAEGKSRQCSACGRLNPGKRPRCLYCNADIRGVEPGASTTGAEPGDDDRDGSPSERLAAILEHPLWYPGWARLWIFLVCVWLLPPALLSIWSLGYIVERHQALDQYRELSRDRFASGDGYYQRRRELLDYQPGIITCLRTGFASLPNAPAVVNSLSSYEVNGQPVLSLRGIIAVVCSYVIGLPVLWLCGRWRHRSKCLEKLSVR